MPLSSFACWAYSNDHSKTNNKIEIVAELKTKKNLASVHDLLQIITDIMYRIIIQNIIYVVKFI